MADGESSISEAADAVEEASDTKALDVVARSGFAVVALRHLLNPRGSASSRPEA
jgi:hypothetical protein